MARERKRKSLAYLSKVEDVVHDLERKAQVLSIVVDVDGNFRGHVAEYRRALAAGSNQRRRLPKALAHVVLKRDGGVKQRLGLLDFPVGKVGDDLPTN